MYLEIAGPKGLRRLKKFCTVLCGFGRQRTFLSNQKCVYSPNNVLFLGNKECSTCKAALASPRLAQVQAFMKLFLKLSDRNAYSTGFTAELEYDKQPANKVTTMTKLSLLGIFSSGLVDRKIKDN